jgi:hypothetical protein
VLRAGDEELIADHLALLDQPANWRVISFLMLRGFGAYLIQLTAQPPLGRRRDRFIYLECLLRYADHCSDDRTVLRFRDAHYEPQHLRHALDQALLWARPLLRIARAAEPTRRVVASSPAQSNGSASAKTRPSAGSRCGAGTPPPPRRRRSRSGPDLTTGLAPATL